MILALAMFVGASVAQDEQRWRNPPACWDGPQSELTHCAYAEYRAADEAMNAQWIKTAALMKRLDVDHPPVAEIGQSWHFDALQNGQRAWLAYRDAYCPIVGASGGSIAPMLRGLCLRDLTLARTQQLKGLMLIPGTDNPYYEDQ